MGSIFRPPLRSTRSSLPRPLTSSQHIPRSHYTPHSLLPPTSASPRSDLQSLLSPSLRPHTLGLTAEMAAVKLTTTLIVVVAVSSLLGCILFLFLIFRCCRRQESAPLPPIQPLAHHREKDSTYLPHPPTFRNSLSPNQLGAYDSDASLLRASGKPSFQTGRSDGTPSSSGHSFSIPSPQTNVSLSPRSTDEEQSLNTQQYISTSRQARSVSRGTRPRSRVISVASSNTIFTQVSPRPTSIIRGAPHSALSNVQIVLPTPLAPQLQNHLVTNSSTFEAHSSSDLDPSTQDASFGRRTRSSFQRPSHSSLDTKDPSNPSEAQAVFRGRNTSECSIQLTNGDTKPPVPSLDDRDQPPKAASQEPRD